MISCAVYGCNNSTITNPNPNVQFYYFPKHPVIADQWLNACIWKEGLDVNIARVCSIHFDADCYTSEYKMLDYTGAYIKMLKHDALPTLHILLPAGLVKTLSTDLSVVAEKTIIYGVPNAEYVYAPNEDMTEKFDDIPDYIKIESTLAEESESAGEKNKYNIDISDLQEIRESNDELKNKVSGHTKSISVLKSKLNKANSLYSKLCESYEQQNSLYNMLIRKSLSKSNQVALLRKVFSESQIKILMGKKKIYWSNDDMAVGYTLRHMSSKRCYTYLTKHLHIPLPALSSIKRWVTLKKGEFDREEKPNELIKLEDSE